MHHWRCKSDLYIVVAVPSGNSLIHTLAEKLSLDFVTGYSSQDKRLPAVLQTSDLILLVKDATSSLSPQMQKWFGEVS